MAREMNLPALAGNGAAPALRGLLVTADLRLARAFRRELRNCADCSIMFDVQASFEEARRAGGGPYDCVTVDLDGSIAPPEAVRRARSAWPEARIAVLACWWSERDSVTGAKADVVIHKPLRSPELRTFLRSPTGAPRPEAFQVKTSDEAVPLATH